MCGYPTPTSYFCCIYSEALHDKKCTDGVCNHLLPRICHSYLHYHCVKINLTLLLTSSTLDFITVQKVVSFHYVCICRYAHTSKLSIFFHSSMKQVAVGRFSAFESQHDIRKAESWSDRVTSDEGCKFSRPT